MPKLTADYVREVLRPVLDYYPRRDRDIFTDRAETCVLTRKKGVRLLRKALGCLPVKAPAF